MGRRSKDKRKRRIDKLRAAPSGEEACLINAYGGMMDEPPRDFPKDVSEWTNSLSNFAEEIKIDTERMWFLRRLLDQLVVLQYYVLVELVMRNLGDFSLTLILVAQYTGKTANLLNHADTILFVYHHLVARIEAFVKNFKEDSLELEAKLASEGLPPEELASIETTLTMRRSVAAYLIFGDDASSARDCTEIFHQYAMAMESACYNLLEAFTGEGFCPVVPRRRFVRGTNLPLLDTCQPAPNGNADAMEFPDCLLRYSNLRTLPNGHKVISRACRRLTTFPKDMEMELLPEGHSCPELEPWLFLTKPIRIGPVVYFGSFVKPKLVPPQEIFEQAAQMLILTAFGAAITNETALPRFLELSKMRNLAEESSKLAREFSAVQRFFRNSELIPLPLELDETWAMSSNESIPSFDEQSVEEAKPRSIPRTLPGDGKPIRRKAQLGIETLKGHVNDMIAVLRHLDSSSSAGITPNAISKNDSTAREAWVTFLTRRLGDEHNRIPNLISFVVSTQKNVLRKFGSGQSNDGPVNEEVYSLYHELLVISRPDAQVDIVVDFKAEELRLMSLAGANGNGSTKGSKKEAPAAPILLPPPPLPPPPVNLSELNLPMHGRATGATMESIVAEMNSSPLCNVVRHHLAVLTKASCQTDTVTGDLQNPDSAKTTGNVQEDHELENQPETQDVSKVDPPPSPIMSEDADVIIQEPVSATEISGTLVEDPTSASIGNQCMEDGQELTTVEALKLGQAENPNAQVKGNPGESAGVLTAEDPNQKSKSQGDPEERAASEFSMGPKGEEDLNIELTQNDLQDKGEESQHDPDLPHGKQEHGGDEPVSDKDPQKSTQQLLKVQFVVEKESQVDIDSGMSTGERWNSSNKLPEAREEFTSEILEPAGDELVVTKLSDSVKDDIENNVASEVVTLADTSDPYELQHEVKQESENCKHLYEAPRAFVQEKFRMNVDSGMDLSDKLDPCEVKDCSDVDQKRDEECQDQALNELNFTKFDVGPDEFDLDLENTQETTLFQSEQYLEPMMSPRRSLLPEFDAAAIHDDGSGDESFLRIHIAECHLRKTDQAHDPHIKPGLLMQENIDWLKAEATVSLDGQGKGYLKPEVCGESDAALRDHLPSSLSEDHGYEKTSENSKPAEEDGLEAKETIAKLGTGDPDELESVENQEVSKGEEIGSAEECVIIGDHLHQQHLSDDGLAEGEKDNTPGKIHDYQDQQKDLKNIPGSKTNLQEAVDHSDKIDPNHHGLGGNKEKDQLVSTASEIVAQKPNTKESTSIIEGCIEDPLDADEDGDDTHSAPGSVKDHGGCATSSKGHGNNTADGVIDLVEESSASPVTEDHAIPLEVVTEEYTGQSPEQEFDPKKSFVPEEQAEKHNEQLERKSASDDLGGIGFNNDSEEDNQSDLLKGVFNHETSSGRPSSLGDPDEHNKQFKIEAPEDTDSDQYVVEECHHIGNTAKDLNKKHHQLEEVEEETSCDVDKKEMLLLEVVKPILPQQKLDESGTPEMLLVQQCMSSTMSPSRCQLLPELDLSAIHLDKSQDPSYDPDKKQLEEEDNTPEDMQDYQDQQAVGDVETEHGMGGDKHGKQYPDKQQLDSELGRMSDSEAVMDADSQDEMDQSRLLDQDPSSADESMVEEFRELKSSAEVFSISGGNIVVEYEGAVNDGEESLEEVLAEHEAGSLSHISPTHHNEPGISDFSHVTGRPAQRVITWDYLQRVMGPIPEESQEEKSHQEVVDEQEVITLQEESDESDLESTSEMSIHNKDDNLGQDGLDSSVELGQTEEESIPEMLPIQQCMSSTMLPSRCQLLQEFDISAIHSNDDNPEQDKLDSSDEELAQANVLESTQKSTLMQAEQCMAPMMSPRQSHRPEFDVSAIYDDGSDDASFFSIPEQADSLENNEKSLLSQAVTEDPQDEDTNEQVPVSQPWLLHRDEMRKRVRALAELHTSGRTVEEPDAGLELSDKSIADLETSTSTELCEIFQDHLKQEEASMIVNLSSYDECSTEDMNLMGNVSLLRQEPQSQDRTHHDLPVTGSPVTESVHIIHSSLAEDPTSIADDQSEEPSPVDWYSVTDQTSPAELSTATASVDHSDDFDDSGNGPSVNMTGMMGIASSVPDIRGDNPPALLTESELSMLDMYSRSAPNVSLSVDIEAGLGQGGDQGPLGVGERQSSRLTGPGPGGDRKPNISLDVEAGGDLGITAGSVEFSGVGGPADYVTIAIPPETLEARSEGERGTRRSAEPLWGRPDFSPAVAAAGILIALIIVIVALKGAGLV